MNSAPTHPRHELQTGTQLNQRCLPGNRMREINGRRVWTLEKMLWAFGWARSSKMYACLRRNYFPSSAIPGDAAFVIRDSGEICFWNHCAETLFGFPSEEAFGKRCSTVLHGVGALGTEVCHDQCSAFQCARKGVHIPSFDMNVTTRSGERIWINVSSIVFPNRRTGHSLLVHLARDISSQKLREERFNRIVAVSREIATLGDAVTGAAPVAPLSVHELEIFRMFAAGSTASRIAKTLGISPQTLRNHLHHINQKLRTHNRLEAVMHALQRRLI